MLQGKEFWGWLFLSRVLGRSFGARKRIAVSGCCHAMVLSLQGRSFLHNLPLTVVIHLLLLSICLNTTTLRQFSAAATPEPESQATTFPVHQVNLNDSAAGSEQPDSSGGQDRPFPYEDPDLGSVSEQGAPAAVDSAAAVHTLGQDDRLVCGVEGCLVSHVGTEGSNPSLAPETSNSSELQKGKAGQRGVWTAKCLNCLSEMHWSRRKLLGSVVCCQRIVH